jgi:hypothetical protein
LVLRKCHTIGLGGCRGEGRLASIPAICFATHPTTSTPKTKQQKGTENRRTSQSRGQKI